MAIFLYRGCIIIFLAGATTVCASEKFNATALQIGNPEQTPIDLTVFSRKGSNAPGNYRVEIKLNNVKVDTRDVFFDRSKEGILVPEFTLGQYKKFGLDTRQLTTLSSFK
ncbi:FimD/PapC N-terminal domain-containing protein, partial [Enterobacter cloacae complex sp. P6RS]|uniref:FimD/PapC N-terminal domain-containing protein n=1 Tax=Enterobacter cloacae complex sp. P6RS TaxID=2779588 RepID=UPI001875A2D7